MAISQTGVRTHDLAVAAAEAVRQTAVAAAGNNQASVTAAEIVFYRAVLASCKTNNNGAGAEAAVTALKQLGTGGA
jgi:hypothetical protein